MPKILITGNGFDLNHGLPTHYNDFIKILNYIENVENKIGFNDVYNQSRNFLTNSSKLKEFSFDEDKIELLRLAMKNNVWYHFFSNEFEMETWIDFENKIEYVLNILFTSIEVIKSKVFLKGSISDESLNYGPELFDNNVEILQTLKEFKIIFLDKNYHLTLNKNFLLKKYEFNIGVDLDKIAKFLIANLVRFKKIFNYYFEVFIYPLYNNIHENVDINFFSSIDKHYTFNYSPTFEMVYNKTNITSFLHGKIDSTLNQIVLGINEVPKNSQIKKYFLPFTKYFQKLDNNTDYKFIKDFEADQYTKFMFFFFGHSLDESDEDYINEVFDFVNDIRDKAKIIIIYHSETSKSELLLNILNIREKYDIQELMKEDILIFRHLDSKELKEDLNANLTIIDSLMTTL